MAFSRKIDMQGDVFNGISSVFAVKDGIKTSGNAATLKDSEMIEFPVSEESGFSFDTGAPSVDHFKVKGLQADWVSKFKPGDGEVKLEVPCNNTGIMEFCGFVGNDTTLTLPQGFSVGGKGKIKGKTFASTQKAIYLGILVLNDSEDKVLYVKKVKFMAQLVFDGSNKPLCVTLTGSVAAGADSDAFGILVPDATA
ncbi:hypothetical protein [Prevotella amnii]|uniref:Phage tail protein n=1 Tax=Prevotella amnii DNF00058 TaxID=1401066 RepID=A0A096D4J4_9BACT|nr:hypothetical protein [Prevotella amnii]KGF52444.1 hypothetical protein HMPREF9302_04010 [Prevotella amnii DNF00058]